MAGKASLNIQARGICCTVVRACRTLVNVVAGGVGSGLPVALIAHAVERARRVHARALTAAHVVARALPAP